MAYLSVAAVERLIQEARPLRRAYPREPDATVLQRKLERAAATAIAKSRRRPSPRQVEDALAKLQHAARGLQRAVAPNADERALHAAWGLIGGALAERAASASRKKHDPLVVARASTLYATDLQHGARAVLEELVQASEAAAKRPNPYRILRALSSGGDAPASVAWAHFLIHRTRGIFSEATGLPSSREPGGPCGRFTIALFRELRSELPGEYELTPDAYRGAARKLDRLRKGG